MKKIGNTILTRKAFRDLTWISGTNAKTRWIQFASHLSRWQQHTSVIRAIDNCILPSEKNGKIVILSIDASKAKMYNPCNTNAETIYIRYDRDDLSSVENIAKAVKAIKDNHPDTDAIYFENLSLVNLEGLRLELIARFNNAFPESTMVFSIEKSKGLSNLLHTKLFTEEMDLYATVTGSSVHVLKSPSGLSGYDYRYCIYG